MRFQWHNDLKNVAWTNRFTGRNVDFLYHIQKYIRQKIKLLGLNMENIYIKWDTEGFVKYQVQTMIEEIDELD